MHQEFVRGKVVRVIFNDAIALGIIISTATKYSNRLVRNGLENERTDLVNLSLTIL